MFSHLNKPLHLLLLLTGASLITPARAAEVSASTPPPATIVPDNRDGPQHRAFVELAKKGGIDVLFLGDSITDWWRTYGKDVFAKYYGSWKIANFGIAGDTTQQVLWRLQNGEGTGFQPKVIMLMIGTNNAGRNTAYEIALGVAAIVKELRQDFPAAKILLLGIFPRGNPGDEVRGKLGTVNALISQMNDLDHVFYLDIGRKFLDANGNFLPGAFNDDKLHPAAGGYEIWAQAVQEPLANLLKAAAPAPAAVPVTSTPASPARP